jgi:hypothetical protein
MLFSLVGKNFLASNKTVYEMCMYNSLSDHITLNYVNLLSAQIMEQRQNLQR